jgi:hypothetical protein
VVGVATASLLIQIFVVVGRCWQSLQGPVCANCKITTPTCRFHGTSPRSRRPSCSRSTQPSERARAASPHLRLWLQLSVWVLHVRVCFLCALQLKMRSLLSATPPPQLREADPCAACIPNTTYPLGRTSTLLITGTTNTFNFCFKDCGFLSRLFFSCSQHPCSLTSRPACSSDAHPCPPCPPREGSLTPRRPSR